MYAKEFLNINSENKKLCIWGDFLMVDIWDYNWFLDYQSYIMLIIHTMNENGRNGIECNFMEMSHENMKKGIFKKV